MNLTRQQKKLIRAKAMGLWSNQGARNPMIRKDGSVVVTITASEGSSRIFVGWADELVGR